MNEITLDSMKYIHFESKEEREERRNMYIARAVAMNNMGADDEQIIKEAGEKFDQANTQE